jgi:isocitrate/isopropylmalate dehydrogenase
MIVRLVLWSLADSLTSVDELRAHLRDDPAEELAVVPGLLFSAWISDAASERWGSISVWSSREASEEQGLSVARAAIGKDPEIVEVFDLEATVSVADELARLGLALEPS